MARQTCVAGCVDDGIRVQPSMPPVSLTKNRPGLIAARMINLATMLTARRRRIDAAWADVSV
jgi:hypothetical protein